MIAPGDIPPGFPKGYPSPEERRAALQRDAARVEAAAWAFIGLLIAIIGIGVALALEWSVG